MQVLVVFESMYGNTRHVAEAIGAGARADDIEVSVVAAAEVNPEALGGVGLLVIGAPTHAWSLPRPRTRQAAVTKPAPGSPRAEPTATEPGVRELLESLPELECPVAAFDTRFKGPFLVTGRSSHLIGRALRRHGATMVTRPQSFFVSRGNHLRAGETARAERWGAELVRDRQRLAGRHH